LTERIASPVRRARARLEAVRLLKAACRGVLVGGAAGLALLVAMKVRRGVLVRGAAGLALLVAMKVLPGLSTVALLPWALLGAGAAVATLLSALGPRIGLDAAALFLDRRLQTQERIVTSLGCPPGPFADRLEHELESVRTLPRFPFPREAALVPATLFLLFAAGLLPEASGEVAPEREAAPLPVAVLGIGAGGTPDVSEALEKLAVGTLLDEEQLGKLRRAIDGTLHRPEDRAAAKKTLERAVAGDEAAALEILRKLGAREEAAAGAGAVSVAAYPDARELLLEYRRNLSEEMNR
jgi:hypothetical protein